MAITIAKISIHAPRMGSDNGSSTSLKALADFNPRSPHGERQKADKVSGSKINFNPRSPHGERRFILSR